MTNSALLHQLLAAARNCEAGLSLEDVGTVYDTLDEGGRRRMAVELYQIAIEHGLSREQAAMLQEQLEAILKAPARVGLVLETYEPEEGPRRGLVWTDGGLIDVPIVKPDQVQVGDRVGIVMSQEGACLASSYGHYAGGINAIYVGREDGHVVLQGEHDAIIRATVAPTLDLDQLEEGRSVVRVAVLGGLEALALGVVQRSEKEGLGLLRAVPDGVTFEHLAGLDPLVNKLKAKVRLWRRRDLAQAYDLDRRRGILLVGIPGTGKTELTYAIASYAREVFGAELRAFEVSSGDLLSKWFGQSEKNIRQAADAAHRAGSPDRPCLLAFQDFEGLVYDRRRADWSVNLRVTSMMNQILDDRQRNWIPLATANCPEIADPATVSRWWVFEVGPPAESGVRAILKLKLSSRAVAEPVDDICDKVMAAMREDFLKVTIAGQVRTWQRLDLLTGRRIAKAVEEAAEEAAARDERFGAGRPSGLTAADVIDAMHAEFDALAKAIVPQNVSSYAPLSLEETQQVSHVHVVPRPTAEVRRYAFIRT